MLKIDIPGTGLVTLEHLVCDFTGTLSFNGKLIPGVKERFEALSRSVSVHVLTSDTFGTARDELRNVSCHVHVLEGENHPRQKRQYVEKLGKESVVAFGNGRNDEEMLKTAAMGVAVMGGEGCAVSALQTADVAVASIIDGFDLLLHPKRLIATLRR